MSRENDKKKLISFRLRTDYIDRLKAIADEKGISLISLLEEGISLILWRYERDVKLPTPPQSGQEE